MTTVPSPPRPPWRERLKERLTQLGERLERRRHGLSWTAVAVGGLGAAVALWPLATTVWDLFGLTTSQTWRVAAAGACALVLAAGVAGVNWKRTEPVRLFWLILASWALAAGAVAAMTALAWLVLGAPQWTPPGELTPQNLDAIATRAFAIVAGLGGVALLVIAYRRQRTTEADAQRSERAAEREVSKLFTDTFDSTSEKLGSEHAAVRLAGVHALARLADEAPEGREDLVQMVIDVLCAYLRMPYTPRPDEPSEQLALPPSLSTAVDLDKLRGTGHDDAQLEKQQAAHEEHCKRVLEFESFQQVRHTIIRIIGNRLRADTRWRGKDYDFTGVVFDGGDLNRARFTDGTVAFTRARFTGGMMNFSEAWFTGGSVFFSGAWFTDGIVDFGGARFIDGRVAFGGARFAGGSVFFNKARFTGSTVAFGRARFTDGIVAFNRARFTDGRVAFSGTRFTGGTVPFTGATFHSGVADFRRAEFSSGKVSFKSISGTCPSGLLESIEHGEPGVVELPEQWQPSPKQLGHTDSCT